MRADQLLVLRGLAASRSQAQRLIASGVRVLSRTGWQTVSKSDDLLEDADIELQDAAEVRYVSRGGLKLEAALRDCGVKVAGLDCLDVGQSTGGFTDCLLQHSAARVVGVDVGHSQLHPKLRAEPRVRCVEGLNMREHGSVFAIRNIANNDGKKPADRQIEPEFTGFDLAVGDVSFISQTLVAPQIAALLKPRAEVLMLVKPQFELTPQAIGKGGLVKDAKHYAEAEQRVRACWQDLGFEIRHYLPSAIQGGDGNTEFFVHAQRG